MSEIAKIKAGKKHYNLAQASASNQRKLMSLIGSKIAYNAKLANVEADLTLVKGVLLATEEKTIDEISDIVLYKCVEAGSDELISIENFQGQMNAYFDLLAEGVKANHDDFFIWLNSEKQEDKAK